MEGERWKVESLRNPVQKRVRFSPKDFDISRLKTVNIFVGGSKRFCHFKKESRKIYWALLENIKVFWTLANYLIWRGPQE